MLTSVLTSVLTSRLRATVAAAALVAATAACGGGSGSAAAGRVGVALPDGTARWTDQGAELARQLRAAGFRPEVQYAGGVAQTQADQVEGMLVHGVRAVVVAPVDAAGLGARDGAGDGRGDGAGDGGVLAQAQARGVAVVAYERPLRDPTTDAYAGYDSAEVGRLQARDLVARLGLDTGARGRTAELFAGAPDDDSARAAYAGALEVLQPYLADGRLVVPSGRTDLARTATLRGSPEVAAQRLRDVLAASPGRVDAVLSPSDAVSAALLTALAQAGYGTAARPLPVVTGRDAELPAVRALAAGRQASTVLTDPRRLAAAAVQLTRAALSGGVAAVPGVRPYGTGAGSVPALLLAPQLVDRDNYARLLVASGRYTPAQLR